MEVVLSNFVGKGIILVFQPSIWINHFLEIVWKCIYHSFRDDKTSGTLLLELERLNINKNEKFKEFNQRFITVPNKILDKPVEAIQIDFYTASLPPPVAMFVKRKEIRTLAKNFVEAIEF